MYRILFICHGNICRSTMAQFVMQDLVNRAGCADDFVIDSAATTNDEIGHPPHQGTVCKLQQVGVPVIVFMDDENDHHLRRIFGVDPDGKCVRLLAFVPGAGLVGEDGSVLPGAHETAAVSYASVHAADVADPWFTGNFDETYRDVLAGCTGLLTWCNDK